MLHDTFYFGIKNDTLLIPDVIFSLSLSLSLFLFFSFFFFLFFSFFFFFTSFERVSPMIIKLFPRLTLGKRFEKAVKCSASESKRVATVARKEKGRINNAF